MSYDDWKSTNRDDERLGNAGSGKPKLRRCLQCHWTGRGLIAGTDHWKATGHSVVLHDDCRPSPRKPSEVA